MYKELSSIKVTGKKVYGNPHFGLGREFYIINIEKSGHKNKQGISMAQPELRELAIAQFIDAGFLDDPGADITADMVRAKNPWKGANIKASLQWATKILFGAKFAAELRSEAGEKEKPVRRNIFGGKRKDIGSSGIMITKKRTI